MTRKAITIEECRRVAEEKGGRCLSNIVNKVKDKLQWECSMKHVWSARVDAIKCMGRWCPICAGRIMTDIYGCIKLAASHNGKCLSTKYMGHSIDLEWECKNGHKWFTKPSNIRAGR
jgi:citrate lyase synthetase